MSVLSKESISIELLLDGDISPEQINEKATSLYTERLKLFTETYEKTENKNVPQDYLSQGIFIKIDDKSANNKVGWCTEFYMLSWRNMSNQRRLS